MFLQKLTRSRLEAYASPLVVVGAAAILAVVVIALAVYNVNRETRFTSRILVEKGALLIRTFEAGTRAGMMGMWDPQQRIQILAEQFALLPGISSIALTDLQGRIQAASEPQQVGGLLLPPEEFSALAPSRSFQWKVVETPEQGRTFMVYKMFTPLRMGEGHHDMAMRRRFDARRGHMAERMRRKWENYCSMMDGQDGPARRGQTQQAPHAPQGPEGQNGSDAAGEGDSQDSAAPGELQDPTRTVLFVTMDVAPFEEARAQDIRTTILLAATLLALGLGGVIALYWAQRLRASRRMLLDTRAFAGEIITHMPMGLVATDTDGRVTMVNNTAAELLGPACDVSPGSGYQECLPPRLAAILGNVLQGEDVLEREVVLEKDTPLSVSGARIMAEEGRALGAILLLRDLRELKRLEAAVRRAEKLAAIGSLAAGVAHEIRNPLSSIKASATYFGSQFEKDSDGERMAEIMIQEVERLNRAVTQLLEYARPSELAAREVEVVPLVQRCLDLVRRDAQASDIELSLDAAHAPEKAWLDPDRLTQALLNLLVNAVQVMEQEEKGGTLQVLLENVGEDRLRIAIRDSGPGLPAGDVKRIFDPYYTTKARGTGLGLAIVQKIVEAHEGEIDVQSSPGKGATFSIILPLRQKSGALRPGNAAAGHNGEDAQ